MMTLELAKRMAEKSFSVSHALGYPAISVVILDHSTAMRLAHRADQANHFGIEIAKAKAMSAFAFKKRTLEQKEQFAANVQLVVTVAAATNGLFMPLGGGAPIFSAERLLIGSIGVTGATPEDDDRIACEAITSASLRFAL